VHLTSELHRIGCIDGRGVARASQCTRRAGVSRGMGMPPMRPSTRQPLSQARYRIP